MSAQSASTGLPFIVSTDGEGTDPETRKLIRSHVMRGKNRIKPRKKSRRVPLDNKSCTEPSAAVGVAWPSEVPRMLCSELSTIKFASSVEPALVVDVLSFSTMFSRAMFLLDTCISTETVGIAQMWFEPMLSDAAYLYAACITVQAYYDGFFSRTRNFEAQRRDNLYYGKAVRILQERLAMDDDEKFSNSTIMTVLLLSGHAYTTGDYESANHHNGGLLKLVSMTGIEKFFQNAKLLIEIVRCDLNLALDTGTKPVLVAQDNNPWPLIVNPSFVTAIDNGEISAPPAQLAPGLAAVWSATYTFCALVNRTATADTRRGRETQISERKFLDSMGAIMYRLLHQQFFPGSLDEAYRLGMLAFLSPIFLHWNRVELPDPRFTATFWRALADLDRTGSDIIPPQERLWLLMVGAVSMAHDPAGISWLTPRLQMTLKVCGVSLWEELRNLLTSMLWVGVVYDRPAKEIFDLILTRKMLCA